MEIKNGSLEYAINNNITSLVPEAVNDEQKKSLKKVDKFFKRTIDIIASIFGIISLLPLTICVYIANLICKDRGPVFYTQNRIGQNGKIFKMYKYRSMIVGADDKLEKYLEENEEARKEFKQYKKLKDDPRVTKVGKFIRKTSIDEFPQFINVLKGEMSLVGPRPYLEKEREDMNGYYQYIVTCKPGLTGLWQVSGRNDCTFDERIDLDMEYYNNHNLKMDVKIIFKTVEKILKKEGAM